MKYVPVLALAASFFITYSQGIQAKNVDSLKETWTSFLNECELVIKDPLAYRDGKSGRDGKTESAISDDGKSLAINKRIKSGYIEVFAYFLTDRDYISCAAYLEHGGSVNSGVLATKFVAWMMEQEGLTISGGNASLYRPREFNFGIEGAWPEYDLATRLRLSDEESQFFVTRIINLR